MLNSTPTGEVIGERQLYRHRTRAGLRITSTADPRNIDLLRYVAWLVSEHHKPRPEAEGLTGYDAYRDRMAQRIRELSLSGRDIGESPPVVNAERKGRAERDFRFFCEQYFSATFHLPWSPDHLKVVRTSSPHAITSGAKRNETICLAACHTRPSPTTNTASLSRRCGRKSNWEF